MSIVKKILLKVMLLLPALVAFASLKFFDDALLTLLLLILLYGLMTSIYNKFIEEFKYQEQLTAEFLKKETKLKEGGMFLAAGFAIFGIGFCFYSRYVSFGIEELKFPFPIRSSWWRRFAYQLIFCTLWLVNAAVEHWYFNFFIAVSEHDKEGLWGIKGDNITFLTKAIISLAYALLSFVVFWWTLEGKWTVLVFTFFAFVFNLALCSLRVRRGIIVSTSLRLGMAIALLVWFLYLYLGKNGIVKILTPKMEIFGVPDNVWNRMFGGY